MGFQPVALIPTRRKPISRLNPAGWPARPPVGSHRDKKPRL
jgi:hypothetical protein